MEMPVDVLNRRLGDIRDNGDIDFDNTMTAVSIDEELQEKFLFFPDAEIREAAEAIEEESRWLVIGQNYGRVSIPKEATVEQAYTLAENALALYWELKRRKEQEAERLAKRPEPGVYIGNGGDFTVIVAEDRRVLVPIKDGLGMNNYSADWDHYLHKSWKLQRIDLATGDLTS